MLLSEALLGARVLAIGSHSDDIEIGCGGTLLRLLAADPNLAIDWIVLTASGERHEEAIASAERFVGGNGTVRVADFRERYFPYLQGLKEFFDELGSEPQPDVVFCPWSGDAHQDHRTAAELVQNTFRSQLVLEYEIPKIDGDLGRPFVFVDLEEQFVDRKIDAIIEGFPSQAHRTWFDPDLFRALMRLRGAQALSKSGYAEAFYSRRLKLL